MKFAFVVPEAENYAVMLFSSLLKERGHEPYLIFDPKLFRTDEVQNQWLSNLFDIRKENIRKIKRIKPDMIGFSVYTQDYQWALETAQMVKEELPHIPIIFGGIHCILCPEQVAKEDCIDYVCASEGEDIIIDLCEGRNPPLRTDKIYSQPYLTNLDSLPIIDRDLFYEQKPVFRRDYSISTGRGCPYSCTFCASDALNRHYRKEGLGRPVRQRSPQNVIEELKLAKTKYHPKSIYFTDDVFTLNLNWLKEFAPTYKRDIGLPFYCTANPGTIKEEEIHLLKEAGCQMIGFGMQSCNEDYRKDYLKRHGTNEHIREIANLCKSLKIHFSFDHIFNLPNEPAENQMEAVNFYNEVKPDIINTFVMTYLPKIELNKYLDDDARLQVEEGKARTAMFDKRNDNITTIFCLIPLLPKNWINFLSDKKWVKFPFWLRLLLKDLRRLQIDRYSDVFFPIRLFIHNVIDNIRIKCENIIFTK